MLKVNETGYTLKAFDAPKDEVLECCGICTSPNIEVVGAKDESIHRCEDCGEVEGPIHRMHESEVEEFISIDPSDPARFF